MTAQENVKACRDQFLEKMNCYQYSLIREAILIAISDSFKVFFHPTRARRKGKKGKSLSYFYYSEITVRFDSPIQRLRNFFEYFDKFCGILYIL